MKKCPYHVHLEVYDDDRTKLLIELELGAFSSARMAEDLRRKIQEANPQYSIVVVLRCDELEHD